MSVLLSMLTLLKAEKTFNFDVVYPMINTGKSSHNKCNVCLGMSWQLCDMCTHTIHYVTLQTCPGNDCPYSYHLCLLSRKPARHSVLIRTWRWRTRTRCWPLEQPTAMRRDDSVPSPGTSHQWNTTSVLVRQWTIRILMCSNIFKTISSSI